MPLPFPTSLGLDLKNQSLTHTSAPAISPKAEAESLGSEPGGPHSRAEPLSGWETMDRSLTFSGFTFPGCKWGNNSASDIGLFQGQMRPCLGNARGGPGTQRVFREGQFCLLPGFCHCCFLNFKEGCWASDLYLLVLELIHCWGPLQPLSKFKKVMPN